MMRERGVAACAMEVSSHALVMGRVDGVVFDVAVFTNLGRDHLDFHADVEDYFARQGVAVHPRAGPARPGQRRRRARPAAGSARPTSRSRTFSTAGARRRLAGRGRRARRRPGRTFTVVGPDGVRGRGRRARCPATSTSPTRWPRSPPAPRPGSTPTRSPPAIAAGGGVPGRLERVDGGPGLRRRRRLRPQARRRRGRAARRLRPLTDGRLIVVLGAGGDRDPGKRPIMGEIAARLADVLVVTDDNPRTEDPAAIRAAMLAGHPRRHAPRSIEIGDRRAAIREAARAAPRPATSCWSPARATRPARRSPAWCTRSTTATSCARSSRGLADDRR